MRYQHIRTREIVEFDGPRVVYDVSTSWERLEPGSEPTEPAPTRDHSGDRGPVPYVAPAPKPARRRKPAGS